MLSALFLSSMIDGTTEGMIFFLLWVVVGIPIAFCFLMYSHPKAEKGINIGIVLAFPICVILSPILGLTMLANKPWLSEAWKNRSPELKSTESDNNDSNSTESNDSESERSESGKTGDL